MVVFFTWTLRRGSFSVRELHQIGESCWSYADGVCVRDRLLGRLLDDSVVIGGDNKHSCAGRRRARRRWHGSTRRPSPAVHQNQHQTKTIEVEEAKKQTASIQSLIVKTWRSSSCQSIRVLVLLYIRYVCSNSFSMTRLIECNTSITRHKPILEDRLPL